MSVPWTLRFSATSTQSSRLLSDAGFVIAGGCKGPMAKGGGENYAVLPRYALPHGTPCRWYDTHSRGPLVRGARDRTQGIQIETSSAGLRHEKQSKATNTFRSLH